MKVSDCCDAVILCGGLGTRLRSVLPEGTPKCLADINGTPFLGILLKHLQQKEFEHFHFFLGFGAEKVLDWIEDDLIPTPFDWTYSVDANAGTGGAFRGVFPLSIISDPFFVFNGDTLCALDLDLMLESHLRENRLATVAYSINDRSVNVGTYIFSQSCFDSMREFKPPFNLEEWFQSGKVSVNWFPVTEPYWDIGTPETLKAFVEMTSGFG